MRTGIDPKVDYAFKLLFGRQRNWRLLLHLLNAALQLRDDERLTELELLSPIGDKLTADDKLLIVDVKARDRMGRRFHVEMQVLPVRAFHSRVVMYWADLHRQQMTEGDPYTILRPTISVCIVDFEMFPQVPDYRLQFELRDAKSGLVFSPDFCLVTLELPKFRRDADRLDGPLDRWMYFLKHGEDLDAESLPPAMQETEIGQAVEELRMISQNDAERELYQASAKRQRDELSRLHSAREDGLEQGREQGLEQGQLVGKIHLCEELLKRSLTPLDQLMALSPSELRQLAQQLAGELPR